MSGAHAALRVLELASERLWREAAAAAGRHDSDTAPAGSENNTAPQDDARPGRHAVLARLDLWRAAWGPHPAPLPLARLTGLAKGLPGHIRLDADALAPGAVFSAPSGKILLNLILLAADSLPTGGIVILAGSADDLFVRIAGPAAAWPVGLGLCAANPGAAEDALADGATMQVAVTAMLAHADGIRLSLLLPPAGLNQPPIVRLGGA